jgi:hypothetical protein
MSRRKPLLYLAIGAIGYFLVSGSSAGPKVVWGPSLAPGGVAWIADGEVRFRRLDGDQRPAGEEIRVAATTGFETSLASFGGAHVVGFNTAGAVGLAAVRDGVVERGPGFPATSDAPRVAVLGDRLVAVWKRERDIAYATGTTLALGEPVSLDDERWELNSLSVAPGRTDLAAVWSITDFLGVEHVTGERFGDGDQRRLGSYEARKGVTLQGAATVWTGDGYAVVWFESGRLRFVESGAPLSDKRDVGDVSDGERPRLSWCGGQHGLVWQADGEVRFRRLGHDGQARGPTVVIARGEEPAIQCRGDRWTLAWVSKQDGRPRVQAAIVGADGAVGASYPISN